MLLFLVPNFHIEGIQVHVPLGKICREFTMKMDDDFPFYYWTLNERFRGTDETYESFDESPPVASNIQPEQHPLRLHKLKINTREDPSIFTAGRSFLPIRDKGSIRQRMHRDPVNLPFTLAPQVIATSFPGRFLHLEKFLGMRLTQIQ